jgi:hypothetical protein
LFADVEDVRSYASDLPAKWLQCRELGHNWGPHKANTNDDGGFDRVLSCRRCTAKRHQVLDSYGRIVSNHYEYPEGYQMPPGQGRISGDAKGVLRLASIHNTLQAQEIRAAGRAGARSS